MLVSNLKFDTSPTEDAVLGSGAWQRSLAEPTITTKDGKTCAYFNGSNSGLISTKQYFPNIDAYKDDWMIMVYIYTSINNAKMGIASKWDYNSSSFKPLILRDYNGVFKLNGGGSATIPINQWNLISVVHTAGNINLYLNDILTCTLGEKALQADALNSAESFTIGFIYGLANNNRFNGYMSDFRIYKDETSIPVSRSELFDDSDKNYYGVKA